MPGSIAVDSKCVDMQYVFFVPGNHDLWTRGEERGKHTSLGKSVPSSDDALLDVFNWATAGSGHLLKTGLASGKAGLCQS